MECDNFTLCKECYYLKQHEHKMKKFVIPEGARPPVEDEIKEILERMKNCSDCSCIMDKHTKYYQSKLDENWVLCCSCVLRVGEGERLRDFREHEPVGKRAEVFDPEAQIGFEDVLANGTPTAF